jgi:hypothetical protein
MASPSQPPAYCLPGQAPLGRRVLSAFNRTYIFEVMTSVLMNRKWNKSDTPLVTPRLSAWFQFVTAANSSAHSSGGNGVE